MTPSRRLATAAGIGLVTASVLSGCNWQGLNSLPLPGAQGRSADAQTLHIEMANVGTLDQNSPVLMDDVVIGSVSGLTVDGWHADVDVSVNAGVAVPANAVASIGQTSLLGSSHLQLQAPVGQAPQGQLSSGDTIPLERSGTYPSTEQTLSSLSVVLNGGGLGQINDVVRELNNGFDGRQDSIKALLGNLDRLMGTLNVQRGNVIATIDGLNRLAAEVAAKDAVVAEALDKLPGALQVLVDQRDRLVEATTKLGTLSDTTTAVVNETKSNLVEALDNLAPVIKAVNDAGPVLGKALSSALFYPFGQYVADNVVKGDYMNLFATLDLRVQRFRTELLRGTPLGMSAVSLPSVVGQTPATAPYTRDPMSQPVTPVPTPPPPAPLNIPGLPQIQLPQIPGLTLPGGGQ